MLCIAMRLSKVRMDTFALHSRSGHSYRLDSNSNIPTNHVGKCRFTLAVGHNWSSNKEGCVGKVKTNHHHGVQTGGNPTYDD